MCGMEKKRRRDDQHATGLRQSDKFLDRLVRIGNVLEHLCAKHHVEGVVAFGNAPYVAAVCEVSVLVSLDREPFFITHAVIAAVVLPEVMQVGAAGPVLLRAASCVENLLARRDGGERFFTHSSQSVSFGTLNSTRPIRSTRERRRECGAMFARSVASAMVQPLQSPTESSGEVLAVSCIFNHAVDLGIAAHVPGMSQRRRELPEPLAEIPGLPARIRGIVAEADIIDERAAWKGGQHGVCPA